MPETNVLIVDDERSMRDLLGRLLRKNGYACTLAADSDEARQCLTNDCFDVLLLDITMPGESGLELIPQVKQECPDIAILMVTATDDAKEVQSTLEMGVYGYIVKPFVSNQILISLTNALRRRELEKKEKKSHEQLENAVRDRTQDLEQTVRQLKESQEELESSKVTLREQLFFLQVLLDAIPSPVFYKDTQGIYLGCNKGFEEFIGLAKDKIVGKTVYEIAPKHLADTYHDADSKLFHNQGKQTYESMVTYADGSVHDVIFNKATYTDSHGNLAGLVGVILDVTERKRAEKELVEANSNLKKTQARIIQQEKMASIGQLAAGVAHEINNPTGFVSSNLKTLQDYQKDLARLIAEHDVLRERLRSSDSDCECLSPILERVAHIDALGKEMDIDFIMEDIPNLLEESREGTERIKKIVLDLKDFAHPGKEESVYADINKNLNSTLNIVWNEIKYHSTVEKDYGDLPEVKCCPQQLNQVFMNLLVNAAQAIEKQGVIKITTKADDYHVWVDISDTGKGIPEENLNKIFDPFFTTKEVGKGTGQGLHVVYNIVKKHKGEIKVTSEVDKGTTFSVKVPIDPDRRI